MEKNKEDLDLIYEIAKYCIEDNRISINLICKKFNLSFNSAKSNLKYLEELGVLYKHKDDGTYNLLVNIEELDIIFNKISLQNLLLKFIKRIYKVFVVLIILVLINIFDQVRLLWSNKILVFCLVLFFISSIYLFIDIKKKQNKFLEENLTVEYKKYKKLFDYYDLLAVIPIFLMIFTFIFTFIVSYHPIDGISMEPNLHSGEFAVVSRFNNDYQRFDIVIVNAYPLTNDSEEKVYIKRIIGLPGETIEYINNELYVNGTYINEEYLIDNDGNKKVTCKVYCKYVVPLNSYFLLGDNREVSKDSTELGSFRSDLILGEVEIIVDLFNKFDILE